MYLSQATDNMIDRSTIFDTEKNFTIEIHVHMIRVNQLKAWFRHYSDKLCEH